MTAFFNAPDGTGKTVKGSLKGADEPADDGPTPDMVEMAAQGARINVLDGVLTTPLAGAAVPRPNGKTTLNLLDLAEAQSFGAGLPGARRAVVHVSAAAQKRGHPSGEGYWLPIDSNNHFVCEPGQRHRKWHFGRSAGCLTRARIAADIGLPERIVTAAWLLTRPQYGGAPETALHADLFEMVRDHLVADNQPCRSDHYFLERGHDYSGFDWG
ncbi:hypothetical protein ACFOM8_22940, partial [Paracoccus angustae]